MLFFNYQREHESEAPAPGLALPLAKALLGLGDDAVELVLMSRNHPQVTLRVFKAIETYSLTVGRAALVGGAPLAPYLDAFDVDLFLSANRDDVQAAANKGIAAGTSLLCFPTNHRERSIRSESRSMAIASCSLTRLSRYGMSKVRKPSTLMSVQMQ